MPSARIFSGQKKQGRARTFPCVKHEPVLLPARSSASPPVPHIHNVPVMVNNSLLLLAEEYPRRKHEIPFGERATACVT